MKLGDMTVKQVAHYCTSHTCKTCPFYTGDTSSISGTGDCKLYRFPCHYDLSMEVKTDAEDQS